MTSAGRYDEDLEQLAADAYALAEKLCGDCRNFHSLWPYLRLAQSSGGDVGEPLIAEVLARLLAAGNQKVLIAGCADTGLLAMVARASPNANDITVLDRCQTPLELCRDYARRKALAISTICLDLVELSDGPEYDVVFAHALLQFIPPHHRLEVLSRIRCALRPGGRLVIAFRTSQRMEGPLLTEYRNRYRSDIVAQLGKRNIPLPEPVEEFYRRLDTYAGERETREGAHQSREEVERLLTSAGFVIESLQPIESIQSVPFRQFAAKISKRRFLSVAQKP